MGERLGWERGRPGLSLVWAHAQLRASRKTFRSRGSPPSDSRARSRSISGMASLARSFVSIVRGWLVVKLAADWIVPASLMWKVAPEVPLLQTAVLKGMNRRLRA